MPGVIRVGEVLGGREHDCDTVTRTYRRVFQVLTDDPNVGAIAVRTAAGVPVITDVYDTGLESDPGAQVVKVSARQSGEDPRKWLVTVEYDSNTFGVGVDQNPLNRPATLSWSTATKSEAMIFDFNDKPVLNSANDPFDPPPERERAYGVLTIAKNVLTFDPNTIPDYAKTVNQSAFQGFPAGECLMDDISSQMSEENAVTFEAVVYKIAVRRGGWNLRVLDAGFQQYVGTGLPGVLLPKTLIRDSQTQEPYSTPQLLDLTGHVLNPATQDPQYIEFEPYESKDWTPLGIP